MMRIASETNSSQMEVKLLDLNQDQANANAELAKAQASIREKDVKIETLQGALQKAYLDLANTRHELDRVSKENEEKTEQIKKESGAGIVALTTKLKEEAAQLAKAQAETAAMQQKLKEEAQRHVVSEQSDEAHVQATLKSYKQC